MGVLSCLRPSSARGVQLLLSASKSKIPQNLTVRQMGDAPPTMIKTASRAVHNQLKDDLHFFFFLGAIPCALIVTGFNLFGGRGELADIPEGYQPHHWEYEKNPLSRFICKHMTYPYERRYEQNLHFHWLDSEKNKMRMTARKIKRMMRDKQDYKAWYYMPVSKGPIDKAKSVIDYDRDDLRSN